MALNDLLTGYGASKFDLPPITGTYKGKGLVVVGDAAGVWDDLERFGCRVDHRRGSVGKPGFDFMTVNKIVEVFPGQIEHAYSNEPKLLHKFIAARRSEYESEFGNPRNTHSCQAGAMHRWPWCGHGTSALGATLAGVGMYDGPIVLCGVPLDDGPHNGEPPWRRCKFMTSEACGPKGQPEGMDAHWKRAKEQAFEGRVFSMSGRTRLWFGEPAGADAVQVF